MKSKMAMLIVLILGGLPLLPADLGNPDLQALCRVTLKDGTMIEGAILAARGGYQRCWDLNGFFITEEPLSVTSDFKLPVLFDFEFLALEPWTGRTYFANGAVGGFIYEGRKPFVYYLEDITYQKLHVEDTKVSESLSPAEGGVGRVLQRTITTNYIYRFSDSIPVFTEIPDGVYLREDVRESFSEYLQVAPAKVKFILVRDIAKFELLHQAPQAWLDVIAAKQARLEKALAKCQECECLYPVWYHEVVKTPEEYRRLLKPWERN